MTQTEQVTFAREFEARLSAFTTAPFLFVGAGLSRRYLHTDGWSALLERMAKNVGRPYAYYASKANGDLPRVATEIAADFHEVWWTTHEFEESRNQWGHQLSTKEGPLKVEVAKHTSQGMRALPTSGDLADELELLSSAVIDGAVTTNYDGLLEHLFDDFKVYVGQDELLFAETQGIGEIYKIHGSAGAPESLVLTQADYDRFGERNPYLAAKLLTIFVEHPVVFLGYSLSDPDVTEILVSIARVLTTANLAKLQDRLIFVQWKHSLPEPSIVSTQIAVAGFPIPIVLVEVSDFQDVFKALAGLRRKFPARLLRQLKERVYDLVQTTDPQDQMAVVDIEDTTLQDDIDVVFGVGVYARLADRGYVGLTRKDLLNDVLAETTSLDPARVVTEALPQVLRGPGNTPIYRYLRGARLLEEDGSLSSADRVDPRIAGRVALGVAPFVIAQSAESRAARLLASCGSEFTKLASDEAPADVFLALLALPREKWPMDHVRDYLLENGVQLGQPAATPWAKAVGLYDWYRYGLAETAKKQKKKGKK